MLPRLLLLLPALASVAGSVAAQQADSSLLTVARIYGSGEFIPEQFGPARWLGDGSAYTTVERAAQGSGSEIVRYDVEKGSREVMVSARELTPQGESVPLDIEDYAWSPDGRMLLVFTNSRPVWRLNTRGDYWVLERTSGRLR